MAIVAQKHRRLDARATVFGAWFAQLGRVYGAFFGKHTIWLTAVLGLLASLVIAMPAQALESIAVPENVDRIEITTRVEAYQDQGDSLQVETASGQGNLSGGVTGRMRVQATTKGTNPHWVVFALTNTTDQRMERWLTADRYNVVNSGAIWPDLDSRRIEALTPSVGFVPDRIRSNRADVFRLTLEPGQTVTFVAEKSSDRDVRLFVWKPLAYELKVRERQLFNGTMLGLTGFLAIFLTAIFAANHKAIFPSAALVAWCVLAYLCVEFGFFHRLFNLAPEDNAVYRAASESSMAASLVIFMHTFLRLGLSHGLWRMLITVWMLAQLSLIAVAVIDPRLSATFARLSFVLIGGVGGVLTLFLALRGQDRALSLIPMWMLFLLWVFATAMVLTGRLSGEVAVAALIAGLVLVVVLIGFIVTQYAFRAMEPLYGAAPTEQQVRALAVDGAGATTWEWNARREEVKVGHLCEEALGLGEGELSTKVADFVRYIHPADRERLSMLLWSVKEGNGGKIKTDFRMRHTDNSYRWFELEASSVPSADARNVRCVGLLRDVTDMKRAHDRLLHDAVHDSLTGLPNRELFVDRLKVAGQRVEKEAGFQPTVLFIDLDKFKSVNDAFGLVVGDSLLLTVARRLQKHLEVEDTLARVGGDQFAILFTSGKTAAQLASIAEEIRTSLRSPIKIAGQEIVLTGSLGLAVWDRELENSVDLLKESEIAMYRAKRSGADRIEIFQPSMRTERDDRVVIESNLRRALERGQIKVLFQPIVYLPTEELAGFEALVRWEHPKLGVLGPDTFIPIAEESDLIVKLGSYVLMRAAHTAARWQKELPRTKHPLFVSVNVSSRQLFRQDLIQEIRHIVGQSVVPPGALRLEITESLVMQNPEQATEILEMLRGAGAELALDDFGTGYSSLAYLQRFPVNSIKIDRSLMQSSSSGEGSGASIVRSMVALAHELGKTVVAEGVERPDDVSFLRSIGCEYAQGFYYGEPMRDRDVIQLLRIVRKTERKFEGKNFFRSKPKKSGKTEDKAAAPSAKGDRSEQRPAAASANADRRDVQVPITAAERIKASAQKTNGMVPPSQSDAAIGRNMANGKGAGAQAAMPNATHPGHAAPPAPNPAANNATSPYSASQGGAQQSPSSRQLPPPPPGAPAAGPNPPGVPSQAAARPHAASGVPAQPAPRGVKPAAYQQPPAGPAAPPPIHSATAKQPTQPFSGPPPVASQQPPTAPANSQNNVGPPALPPNPPAGPEKGLSSLNGEGAAYDQSVGKGTPLPLQPDTAEAAPLPDYSNLPPGIAASLARLAGSQAPADTQTPPHAPPAPEAKKKTV